MSARDIWPEVRIGDALRLINGYAFKPSDWSKDGGLPIVRIQNLNRADAPFNYYKGVLPLKVRLSGGELLFAWSGTPGTSFGAYIWSGGDAWLNQHIFKVEFDPKQFDLRFLRYAINRNLQEYIAAAHGGAGLAHITKDKFEASSLPLPPLDEQCRIVAEIEERLCRLEAGVAALKRVQANLKRYRAAVLADAVGGGFPSIPLGELSRDAGYGTSIKCAHAPNGIGVLRIPNISSGRIDVGDLKRAPADYAYKSDDPVEPGDLLIIRTNGSKSLIGRGAVVLEATSEPLLFASYLIRLRLKGTRILWRWVSLALESPQIREWIETKAASSAGQHNISLSLLRSLPLPLPSDSEQIQILSDTDRRLSVVEELETQVGADLARAERLRQAVLQNAFRCN